MEPLFEKQDLLLRSTSMKIVRSYMGEVNWNAQLLCIRGPRGVGKSTLLLQYIKQNFPLGSREALYCALDWVYFSQHSMLEVAQKFNKMGGKLLIFDEVHKYDNWSREVKEIAELYPSMQVFLSGSSLLNLLNGDADLSRRCRGYDMPGLSFREYLIFYHQIHFPKISLEEMLDNPVEFAYNVNEKCRPLQHFHDYLNVGYYPYYLNNRIDYYPLIEQMVNYVVDVELPQLRGISTAKIRQVKALLNVLAQLVPFEVDISKLARAVGLQRNTVLEYLNHLADAKLLTLLYSDAVSITKMQKPDKIYLDNPNLLYSLATMPVKIGTARECFAINQLSYNHKVEYGKAQGDFRIDGKWTFAVGGEDKTYDQIADLPNSYIFADDIEMPYRHKLPLWLLGFMY